MEFRADPLGDGISCLEYVDHMGDDERVVQAARVSYSKDTQKHPDPGRLIRYLLRHGHWSPFEHCYLTVHVACPLFVARQWFRHKSWSFNEVSRRYTSEDMEFYVPMAWRMPDPNNKQASIEYDVVRGDIMLDRVGQVIDFAAEQYEELLSRGVAREQARMVLPQAMYTRFYATASLRSLIHFIQARMHEGAQWETQQYGHDLSRLCTEIWPLTFSSLEQGGQDAK